MLVAWSVVLLQRLLLLLAAGANQTEALPFLDVHPRCPDMNGQPAECRRIEDCATLRRATFRRCRFDGYRDFVCCPYTPRKSIQACREYQKSKQDFVPFGVRILEGSSVEDGKYSHMAAIGFLEDGKVVWGCGGTLLSANYVLTAAHCMRHHVNGRPVTVRLGQANLTDGFSTGQDYPIEEFVPHPNFTLRTNYYDIALVKLARKVDFTQYIFPACLFSKASNPDLMTVAGWGATDSDALSVNENLQEAELRSISLDTCRRFYRPTVTRELQRGLSEDMLCAMDPLGKSDTCQGDSGGPIQVLEGNASSVYSVVGVTSFGPNPCGAMTPSVYTSVFSYLDWIENIVWP